MVFVSSLLILVFCDFLCLIVDLFTFGVWTYHFVFGVVLLLVFSCLILAIAFYV